MNPLYYMYCRGSVVLATAWLILVLAMLPLAPSQAKSQDAKGRPANVEFIESLGGISQYRLKSNGMTTFPKSKMTVLIKRECYQIPISFHQPKPTVDQMAKFTSDATKPTCHHLRNET